MRGLVGPDSVRNLEIWREGVEIVKEVYLLSKSWPKEEAYGLTTQARRAAVSIPANLAEGVGRGSPSDTRRYARIALSSVYELDTLLVVSEELGFASQEPVSNLRNRLCSLCRRISSFIKYQGTRTA